MEQLGAFFQFLSEFHSKAIEERLQREDEARRQEAQRKKAEEDAAARQGQAAVEEAERNKVEKLQKLRALVEGGGGPERRRLVKQVYGVGNASVFAVSEEEALFADHTGLQKVFLRKITTVRNDPASGALLIVVREEPVAGP
jgi:hypothetical protein